MEKSSVNGLELKKMRKWLIWFLVFLLSFFPIFKKQPLIAHAATFESTTVTPAPLPTRSEGVEITPISTVSSGAVCAMANMLTWEMLQTYMYAVTGQQAYDIYANDAEKQKSLYLDFVKFCQETGYSAKVLFQYEYAQAVSLKQTVDYYSTLVADDIDIDIESDLKQIQEGALNAIDDILKNGIQPEFTPTPTAKSSQVSKITKITGIGTLTGIIGK